jgi:DNA-binding transcriptional regulator YiaG
MIPKMGKNFPERTKTIGAAATYTSAISGALRAELGDTHQAVKKLARWTGANERTVKNWLSGRCGPSGKHLVLIIQNSDTAANALFRLTRREPIVASLKISQAHQFLANAVKELELIMHLD